MPRARKKQNLKVVETSSLFSTGIKKAIAVIILVALAFFIFLALFELAGPLGIGLHKVFIKAFNWLKYFVPFLFLLSAYLVIVSHEQRQRNFRLLGVFFCFLSASGLVNLIFGKSNLVSYAGQSGSGYAGLILSYPILKLTGPWAGIIILVVIFLISLFMVIDGLVSVDFFRERWFDWREKRVQKRAEEEVIEQEDTQIEQEEIEQREDGSEEQEAKVKEDTLELDYALRKKVRKQISIPLKLLASSKSKAQAGNIKAIQEIIKKTLANFGIKVEMADVSVGPTVTQYALKPDHGVKLSQITALQNDLALALAAHPLRIEAPIPGKSLVGIEVPNSKVAIVTLKELLDRPEFQKKRSSDFTLPLGKDVSGRLYFADLLKMPHLLIAGATGSGKSVMINSLIISLLYQNSPDLLKFILVDPKRVELTHYNNIPHLLTPVITDVKKTINALRWTVSEMDRRYLIFEEAKKRNILSYNQSSQNPLPYLIVIIDELADLMAVSAKEVEALIIRLAQMARAVGIHLILATQRPSVDVITGLIKANITNRVAFAVASQTDSRTILDSKGADKLLGRGDLLYISPELSKPKRMQGSFVSDKEIKNVVKFLTDQAEPEYLEEVVDRVSSSSIDVPGLQLSAEDQDDELYEQAYDLVVKAQKASASYLQRRLRIGYARAARLLDMLEEQGVIGQGDGAKAREVLVGAEKEVA